MTEFDYKAAIARLRELLKEIEDPETSLERIDAYIKESNQLVEGCRAYLRSAREKLM